MAQKLLYETEPFTVPGMFTSGAAMDGSEHIARKHGFESHSQLASISHPLPKAPGDLFWTYVARGRDGRWFLWEDSGPPDEAKNDGQGKAAD